MKSGFKSCFTLAALLFGSGLANAAITVNVRGICVDAPPLNDGFGWNGTEVCSVNAINRTGTMLIAASGDCIDTKPLNDGYGWTGTRGCALARLETTPVQQALTTSNGINVLVRDGCVDAPPLNDGNGWNGAEVCSVNAYNTTGTIKIAANGNCIDTIPLNDGFGWTGSNGCVLPPLGAADVQLRPGEPPQQVPTQDAPPPETPLQNPDVLAADEALEWWKPLASDNLSWQMQLQGDIRLIDGVDVYAVDYTASQASIDAAKAAGAKVMCYISAGSAENWRPDFYDFPTAVVGNAYDGWPGEYWLDTRNISQLAPVMLARIQACKDKGFAAIDADNVNGFENETGFDITREDSIRYIRWLANESHRRGMAFSLKNSETLVSDLLDTVDMMQTESCFRWGNCANAGQLSAVNKPVFAVEYQEFLEPGSFAGGACDTAARYNFSMIYRDLYLTPNGIYLTCD